MAATSLDAGLVRPSLDRSFTEGRAVSSLLLTIGAWLAVIVASIPLFSVLYMLIVRGGARLGTALFTQLPPAGFMAGGGFGNAIVGTVVMVGIAAIISAASAGTVILPMSPAKL